MQIIWWTLLEKRQLDAMLLSYHLLATAHFPTRIQNQPSTAVDNIFTDIYEN
jgi:hypothetical protein